jgi:hypothetical protein
MAAPFISRKDSPPRHQGTKAPRTAFVFTWCLGVLVVFFLFQHGRHSQEQFPETHIDPAV